MKQGLLKYNLLLHLVVFIFGFTGILGKLTTITGPSLVWYRMGIATISLLLLAFISKAPLKISFRSLAKLVGIGAIVAIHWIGFFMSIKMTQNVSIALVCLSTGALFTSLLEPLFFKTKISGLEVGLGVVIIGAIILIANTEYKYINGMIVGISAAFLASLFTVLNKKMIEEHHGLTMSFYEMAGGFALLSIAMCFIEPQVFSLHISNKDLLWVTLLGTICTGFAFWASNIVLKKLTAFYVVLAVNLEPVYTIILAIIFFNEHEQLTYKFYIGAALLILSVALYSYLKSSRSITLIKKS